MKWQKARYGLMSVLILGLVIADAGKLKAQMITPTMKNLVWLSETSILTVVMIAGQNGVPPSGDYNFSAKFNASGWQGTLTGPGVQLVFIGAFDQNSNTGSCIGDGVFGNMSGQVTGGVSFEDIGTTKLDGHVFTSCFWPAEEDTECKKIWDCESGESAGLVWRTLNGKRQGPPMHETDHVSWPPPVPPPPPQFDFILILPFIEQENMFRQRSFSFGGQFDPVAGTLTAKIQAREESP